MLDHTAYIAVGSNLGERAAHIARAIELLRATPGVHVARVSSLLDNPAVGGPADSPPFLNGAIEVNTSLDARALLGVLLRIEKSLGRTRAEKWGPRTIDLDLLLYDQFVIDEPALAVPHPRLHERRFVLDPLAELAPHVMHPTRRKSIRQLRDALD